MLLQFGIWGEVASTISATSGAASVLAVALNVLATAIARRRKYHALQKQELESVLQSDDLQALGEYMDDTLGGVSMLEYSSSSAVASRVDRFIERVQDFVGTSDRMAEKTEPVPEFLSARVHPSGDEFEDVLRELETGEPWNALARLRRQVERRLRALLGEPAVEGTRPRGAAQLLRRAMSAGLIDEQIKDLLSYALSVSNRAVHGVDVEYGEAEEAIWAAAHAMKLLSDREGNRHVERTPN